MHPARRTDSHGFRLRGGENTRIEAFTDAAFAFAVTLLVIGGGHIPTNVNELLDALRGLPAYALSFALLCLFWYAHYDWYRHYGLEDGGSIVLSLLLVFLVLIYVYPLHMMFDAAVSIGGGNDAGTARVRSWHDWRIMYMVFGVAYASMSAIIVLLHAHAWRRREALELDAAECLITRFRILRWCASAAVGLTSAGIACAIPTTANGWIYALPGLIYWSLSISGPLLRRRLRRRLATIAKSM
jgi:uncharacterized membrane protein